ncbi:hypothetical protein V1477_014386 [Vespula maculifrons]|uniref:Uncharacterized protein n=1 Tax=Vespula maculifrons TaxID=7453 RepID=A0ABD2BKW9_VESMC
MGGNPWGLLQGWNQIHRVSKNETPPYSVLSQPSTFCGKLGGTRSRSNSGKVAGRKGSLGIDVLPTYSYLVLLFNLRGHQATSFELSTLEVDVDDLRDIDAKLMKTVCPG